jgi:uncharacterized membrane protein YbaN (DUF454 family)
MGNNPEDGNGVKSLMLVRKKLNQSIINWVIKNAVSQKKMKSILHFIYIYIYTKIHTHTHTQVQRDATLVSLFYCKITLHVSGTFRTHHQEYNKL